MDDGAEQIFEEIFQGKLKLSINLKLSSWTLFFGRPDGFSFDFKVAR